MRMFGIDLAVHGNNYEERKNDVREKAITWQQCAAEHADLSMYELQLWTDYFEEQGKRYGLLAEFHENGIC